MLQEVETLIALIWLKTCSCPLYITPHRIDMTQTMLHQHINQATTNQSCGSCDKDVALLR